MTLGTSTYCRCGECRNAECRYADCSFADCHYAGVWDFLIVTQNVMMLSVEFLFCHAECHDAECRHAECHYAKCRGTFLFRPKLSLSATATSNRLANVKTEILLES